MRTRCAKMMAMSELPGGSGPVWNRFTVDPRAQGTFRASDRDRDVVRDVLHEAYAEGRLSKDELDERIDHTLKARQLGELVPLVDDVSLPERRGEPDNRRARRREVAHRQSGERAGLDNAVIGVASAWLFVAIVTNAVWVLTGMDGSYWPVWPMFGMGIGVLAMIIIRFAVRFGRGPG